MRGRQQAGDGNVHKVLAGVAHALRHAQQETLQPTKVFAFAWSAVSPELAATGL